MKPALLMSHIPFLIAILGFTAAVGHEEARIFHLNKTIQALQTQQVESNEFVTTTQAESISLERSIDKLSSENLNLRQLVRSLQMIEPEVRYITKTETKLIASEPVVTFTTPPAHYVYSLDKQIPVGSFDVTDNKYKFTTYDLSFRSTLVVGEKASDVLVQVQSSADNEWHDVPSSLVVHNVSKHYPRFGAQLHGGIGMSSDFIEPHAVLAVPLIKATSWLDFVAPGIGVSNHINAELLVAGVNAGSVLPLVDDVWLWGGASINTTGSTGVSVAVTTGF